MTATERLHGVVAMDGPSGTGKSTVSRRLASAAGAAYLDTGAMYRAVTLAVLRAGLAGSDPDAERVAVAAVADVESITDPQTPTILLAGADVGAEIRGPDGDRCGERGVGAAGGARALVARQQELIAERPAAGGIVVEGRDIGSVVVPDAPLKVYLTASEEVRAGRRGVQDRKAGRGARLRGRPGRRAAPRPARLHPQDLPAARRRGRRGDRHRRAERRCRADRAAAAGEGARTGPIELRVGAPPPGSWPWLHDLARWVGTWWFRPFFRVRWHHRDGIPATRAGGAGGQPQHAGGGAAAVRAARPAGGVPGQAGDVPRRDGLGAAADRAAAGAPRGARPPPAAGGGGRAAGRRAGRRVSGGHARQRRGGGRAARRGLAGPQHRRRRAAGGVPRDPAAGSGGPALAAAGRRAGGRARCASPRVVAGSSWPPPPRRSGPRWPGWCENSTRYGATAT